MSKESLKELRERLLRDEQAQELIRMRAFEIYTLRGGQPGGEAHDWFQAESEVITFLIEEESSRTSNAQPASAPTESEDTSRPTTATKKPAKRGASKTGAARKATPGSAAKKATPKRAPKKSAEAAAKPRAKTKKDS
jgi:hypothetical protein